MVRTFRQRFLALALLMSTVWVLSDSQVTQAQTSESMQQQQSNQDCSIRATSPYRTSSKIAPRVVAYGYISCKESTGVQQIWVVAQLQQFTNGEWTLIAYHHEIGGGIDFILGFGNSASASVPCSVSSPTQYRTIVSGQYRNASGWHAIDTGHTGSNVRDAWISCT